MPSPAVCQLKDVESILDGGQDGTTYKMVIAGNDQYDECAVILKPESDEVMLIGGINLRDGNPNSGN